MKEINYWDRFLVTGSINDFLSYKNLSYENARKETENDETDGFVTKAKSGGHSHAGVYRDYGNDFKS